MSGNNDPIDELENKHPIADRITGMGQKIIGEVEMIGGILTGDPNTAAEGEFNVEVGDAREELEEDLESSKPPHGETAEYEA